MEIEPFHLSRKDSILAVLLGSGIGVAIILFIGWVMYHL